jgi:hypothetical protein
VSLSARRTIAWCSYTVERRPLETPTYAALVRALDGLGLVDCDAQHGGLVKLATKNRVAASRAPA